MVGFLETDESGQTYFHDGNITWPVESNLEDAEITDLPEAWTGQGVPVHILEVETVSGDGDEEAFGRLLKRLEQLHSSVPVTAA